jgi:hypothetical protein
VAVVNLTEPDTFRRLTAPFPADSVSFKPQAVNGRKALAIAYLDARAVMDRLDDVFGQSGWQDDYEALPGGAVKCTLRLRVGDEWVSKSDVGSRSDQPDEGDQVKAAFSDSLKRAAVKWGIGRYLYHLPKQWVGYDPDRRCFTESPRLPDWALPDGAHAAVEPKAPSVSSTTPATPLASPSQPRTAHQPPGPPAAPASHRGSASLPANGTSARPNTPPTEGRSLFRWLKDQEKELVDDRFCRPGELVEHVAQAGAAAGHGTAIVRWNAPAVTHAIDAALDFIARRKGDTAEAHGDKLPPGNRDIAY